MRLRLEYKSESSSKFWEPRLDGNTLTVCFGKIGTAGQTNTKKFASSDKVEVEYRKLVCEKLAKGYKPIAETMLALVEKAMPVQKPEAIASLYIGEHVPDELVADICGWATACIQHGMTLRQFKGVWEKFMEGDEELAETLGRTSTEVSEELNSPYWLDVTEWGEGELSELYAKALENGGDRFVWHDNSAYIDIVALRGDPGARAIEICVLQEENCKDEKGRWLSDWPAKLGPGAPIASMSCDDATLRNGKRIKSQNLPY